MRQIGIGTNVSRVFTAQLQTNTLEEAGCTALNHLTPRHRTRKRDKADLWRANQFFGAGMIKVQKLKNPLRYPRLGKHLDKTLGTKRGLCRMFKNHRVAAEQGWHHHIDCSQVRIIPRRNNQNLAHRITANKPVKPVFGFWTDRVQRFRRDGSHVPCPLLKPRDLAWRKANRPAHLPGQLEGELSLHRDKNIDCAVDQF